MLDRACYAAKLTWDTEQYEQSRQQNDAANNNIDYDVERAKKRRQEREVNDYMKATSPESPAIEPAPAPKPTSNSNTVKTKYGDMPVVAEWDGNPNHLQITGAIHMIDPALKGK